MAIYIGSKIRIFNGTGYDVHYFQTHANAVTETADKVFVTDAQKTFLSALMDGGSTAGTSYGDLVNDVTHMKQFFDMGTADADSVISKLNEILAFVQSSNIAEGMSLSEFIESVTPNIMINDSTVNGATVGKIYTPTAKGLTNQVLVAGSNGYPTWSGAVQANVTGNYSNGSNVQIYGTGIVLNDLSNLKVGAEQYSDILKSSVVSATEPSASAYGRSEHKDGDIWIDIGTNTPSPVTALHTLKMKYTSLNINECNDLIAYCTPDLGVSTKIGRYVELQAIDNTFYPLVVFETAECPYAFGILVNTVPQAETDFYRFVIMKSTVVNSYNVFVNEFFVIEHVYSDSANPELKINVSTTKEVIIPSARIVVNNLHLISPINKNFKFLVDWS